MISLDHRGFPSVFSLQTCAHFVSVWGLFGVSFGWISVLSSVFWMVPSFWTRAPLVLQHVVFSSMFLPSCMS